MLIDYHLHNHLSPDSKTNTRDLVVCLQKLGIHNICITNHGEWFNIESSDHEEIFNFDEAFKRFSSIQKEICEIRKEFPDMIIGFGAELQYRAKDLDDTLKFAKSLPFDFLLGSVHFVEDTLIANSKFAGDLFKNNDEHKIYTKYFKNVLEWVQLGIFDVVAHFDIIKKAGYEYYGPFKPEKYKPLIWKILEEMKKRGIGMEVNTKCMFERCSEPFPHPDILKWCVEVGIENYTVGSDAHEIEEVGRGIPEAMEILKDVGVKKIATYKNRKVELVPL